MRSSLIFSLALLLTGCQGSEYVLAGVVGGLVGSFGAMSRTPEEPDYPNASTYQEIDGITVPDTLAAEELAGTYSIAVGMHEGRTLHLRPDLSLSYRALDASFGMDTTVVGTWSLSGNALTLGLPPLRFADGFRIPYGHSAALDVVQHDGRFVLVPLDRKGVFLQFGPSSWSAFI